MNGLHGAMRIDDEMVPFHRPVGPHLSRRLETISLHTSIYVQVHVSSVKVAITDETFQGSWKEEMAIYDDFDLMVLLGYPVLIFKIGLTLISYIL